VNVETLRLLLMSYRC